jgi:hypothetical protein
MFGSTMLNGPGEVIAKLDKTGSVKWAKLFGPSINATIARDLVTDSAGDIFWTGTFQGMMDFGGGVLTSANEDFFLAELDPNGNHLFSTHWGNTFYQTATSIELGPSGEVVLSGGFNGDLSFGSSLLTNADVTGANEDVFVARFVGLP